VQVLQQGDPPGELRAAEFCAEGAAVGWMFGEEKAVGDMGNGALGHRERMDMRGRICTITENMRRSWLPSLYTSSNPTWCA